MELMQTFELAATVQTKQATDEKEVLICPCSRINQSRIALDRVCHAWPIGPNLHPRDCIFEVLL